jgi:hypothetical protein
MAGTALVRLAPRVAALQEALAGIITFTHAPLAHRGAELLHVARALTHIGGIEALFKTSAFFDPEPIVAFLRRHLAFDALSATLIVTATDLSEGRPAAFYAFTGPDAAARAERFAASEPGTVALSENIYAAAVRASAAIPIAFAPVLIEDGSGVTRPYVDGGLANNSPIRQAIDAGADDVTLVLLDNPCLHEEDEFANELAGIGMTSFSVTQRRLLELDLKLVRTINEAVRMGAAPQYREIGIRVISPSVPLGLPLLGFERQASIDRAFEIGHGDGLAAARSQAFSA